MSSTNWRLNLQHTVVKIKEICENEEKGKTRPRKETAAPEQ